MGLAPDTSRYAESTGQRQVLSKSPRAQPVLAPIWNVVGRLGGCPLSPQESLRSRSGSDRTAAQSAGASHLPSSDPTSRPSGFRCSRSEVFASSATLLLYTGFSVLRSPVESTVGSGRYAAACMLRSDASIQATPALINCRASRSDIPCSRPMRFAGHFAPK